MSISAQSIPKTQSVIFYEKNGGPEVLQYSTNYPTPQISDSQILVKNHYAGINYIETYFRKGIYKSNFPYIPGREASGEIVAIGSNVNNFKIGDKIAYLGGENFAQFTKLDSNKVSIINLGQNANDNQLKLYSASLLQGLTALTFINEAYNVQKDDFILVTAAAGGVGLILDQLISKVKKAHVIAVASSDEKLQLAKNNGAEFLLNSSKLSYDQIADEILRITNGKGVHAVFDSIGKDTIDLDLKVIRRKGTIVSYGNASGPIDSFSLGLLSPKNVRLLRPQLFGYITEPEEFQHYTKQLFNLIDSGELHIEIFKVYPLKDYKIATEEMESRKTTGKLLLQIP